MYITVILFCPLISNCVIFFPYPVSSLQVWSHFQFNQYVNTVLTTLGTHYLVSHTYNAELTTSPAPKNKYHCSKIENISHTYLSQPSCQGHECLHSEQPLGQGRLHRRPGPAGLLLLRPPLWLPLPLPERLPPLPLHCLFQAEMLPVALATLPAGLLLGHSLQPPFLLLALCGIIKTINQFKTVTNTDNGYHTAVHKCLKKCYCFWQKTAYP